MHAVVIALAVVGGAVLLLVTIVWAMLRIAAPTQEQEMRDFLERS